MDAGDLVMSHNPYIVGCRCCGHDHSIAHDGPRRGQLDVVRGAVRQCGRAAMECGFVDPGAYLLEGESV